MARSWFKEDVIYDNLSTLRQNQMHAQYQRVFGTKEGVIVFAHILSELCFFRETETEEEAILHNFAQRLLRYCGSWPEGATPQIVAALMKVWEVTGV